MRLSIWLIAGMVFLAMNQTSRAAVVVQAAETGSGVEFSSTSGSINLTGLNALPAGPIAGFINPVNPAFLLSTIGIGTTNVVTFGGGTAPVAFGTGGFATPTSASGAGIGADGAGNLFVRLSSVSGSTATIDPGMMTFSGASFASLGMMPGTYVWTQPNDTLTLNVVPLPAAGWFLLTGLAALFGLRRGVFKRMTSPAA